MKKQISTMFAWDGDECCQCQIQFPIRLRRAEGMKDRAKRNSIFMLRAFVARNAPCLGAAGNGGQIGNWQHWNWQHWEQATFPAMPAALKHGGK